jgi:hypothetical protein
MKMIDFGALDYDAWLEAVFDHPAPSTELEAPWYWGVKCRVSRPRRVVGLFTRTCKDFRMIGQRFSLPQINQGVWLLLGARLRVSQYLFDGSLPWAGRASCIAAMYSVFADFVAGNSVEEMENCFYMWWELVMQGEPAEVGGASDERTRIKSLMLEVLQRILALPDERCQTYALHGLGHLGMGAGAEVVAAWLIEHRAELDEDTIRWVEQCKDGTVQ